MDKILELREKRAKVWDNAKNFLDSKRSKDGLISNDDSKIYETMESEVVSLGKEIGRLERQAAFDLELSKPINKPILESPYDKVGSDKIGSKSNEYKNAFWNVMRSKSGIDVQNSLNEGTNADGGFLVPDEFERTLVEALEEENIFRKLATIIKTSSGDRKIPVVATKGAASWVDEEGLIPESDDTFGQVSIGAYKLATLIKVSEELLNDSAFNLETYIAKEFGRRIGRAEEEAFFTGSGTNRPTGILANVGGAQLGATTASQAAITIDEVMDLFFSLKSPYRKKAVF
jgi:HK97 family phage major capsid protein